MDMPEIFSAIKPNDIKNLMKIPRKCHSQEAQPSRGTRRRRDEEQSKDKANAIYKNMTTQIKIKTATEKTP